MAKSKEHSFDISAKLDMQEMKNAIVQAQKEVDNRYDFKGITKEIDLNIGAKVLTLLSGSDNKIDAMKDILISKMNKRGVLVKKEITINSCSPDGAIDYHVKYLANCKVMYTRKNIGTNGISSCGFFPNIFLVSIE